MGWTSIIAINNDQLNNIENDPEFGKKLVAAIHESFSKTNHRIPGTGAVVVLQYHRNTDPVVVTFKGRRAVEIRD